MCARVKSTGQPDAGNPHVRLDEGAPVVDFTDDRALLDTRAPPRGPVCRQLQQGLVFHDDSARFDGIDSFIRGLTTLSSPMILVASVGWNGPSC